MRKNMILPCRSIIIAFILLLWFFPASIIGVENTVLFERGNDFLRKQKYSEALSAYETFIKENPEHRLVPAAKWTTANIYLVINNNHEKAVTLFQKIINENSDTEWEICGYNRLSYCFEEQEKWEQAAEIYQATIRKLSSSEDTVTQQRVDRSRRRLLSCYNNMNDHKSLIRTYEEILTENPAASSASEDQFYLAQSYLAKDNIKKAAENFGLVVERYPASNYAQRVQSEQVDLLGSQLDYDWTRFSTFQTGLNLRRAGQYNEALSIFDEIIKATPNTGMAYGAIFQKQLVEYQKNGDAAALIEIISASRDNYPYGFGGVSIDQLIYFLQGIVEAQETLESDPDNVGAYVQMGACYNQTQAYYCGIDTLKKAIAIAPNVPNLYNMLGYCYLGAQKYDEAISTFQRLIEVDPDNPNSYDSMAEFYYNIGDTTMAIQLYEQALAIDSTFSNPYYMLGRIYHELEQNKKATNHLEKYLELDPNGYQSQRARGLLSQ